MKYRILKDGEQINFIISDEAFISGYCDKNGYTYEPVDKAENDPPTEHTQTAADEILNILLGGGFND